MNFKLLVVLNCAFCIAASAKLKVGIIGGGIGGTATAYFIAKYLRNDAEITIFEAKAIGGRLRSLKIGGRLYEAGGAIIISRYMVNFLDELGLKQRRNGPSTYLGLYNGKEVVFAENEWMAVNIARLLWRYGLGLHSLNSHIGRLLDMFDNVYHLQADNTAFENVTDLLNAMNPHLKDSMWITAEEGFREAGFSSTIIEELVGASLRVNYGQTTAVHKLVASVSVAGAGAGLWAVDGGNQRVPEELAKKSKAKVVMRPVTSVTRLPTGRMAITLASRSDIPPDEPEHVFDVVVVATPQTDDMPHKIDLKGFPSPISFPGRYQRTICTMLVGELRIDAFPGAYDYTGEILLTVDNNFFNSIGRIFPVDTDPHYNGSHVWKIFSHLPLSNEQLNQLFAHYRDVTITDWLAYPHYDATRRLDSFLLAPGLYHVNAIEWAASAMEMSVIGARNVANLIRNKWCSNHDCLLIKEMKQHLADEL